MESSDYFAVWVVFFLIPITLNILIYVEIICMKKNVDMILEKVFKNEYSKKT